MMMMMLITMMIWRLEDGNNNADDDDFEFGSADGGGDYVGRHDDDSATQWVFIIRISNLMEIKLYFYILPIQQLCFC